jgi:hypothetical protein
VALGRYGWMADPEGAGCAPRGGRPVPGKTRRQPLPGKTRRARQGRRARRAGGEGMPGTTRAGRPGHAGHACAGGPGHTGRRGSGRGAAVHSYDIGVSFKEYDISVS